MDAILSLLSNETVQTGIGSLLGGSALGLGSLALKLGLKPTALIGSLFRKKKNPIKELMDVIKAVKAGKPRDKVVDEIYDVLEALKPMLRGKK